MVRLQRKGEIQRDNRGGLEAGLGVAGVIE